MDDHPLAATFVIAAFTDGFQFSVALDVAVNGPALERAEWADSHGIAPAANFIHGFEGFRDQLVALAFPVAFAIHNDTRRVGVGPLEDAVQEELQLVERLAAAADEPSGVGGSDV